MESSHAYPSVVSLVLTRISVAGDRIGRNFEFTLRAGELTTQFGRRIRAGESAVTSRLLYAATFEEAAAPITLPVQIQLVERDRTPDTGGASTMVRLDPAVSQREAVAIRVEGRGPRDEGKVGVVTLELVTEVRQLPYRVAPQPLTPGRLQAVRVLGPRPPLGTAKYAIKGRDGKPAPLKVVSAAPLPTRLEFGGVRVLLEDGAPVGVEPRTAPTAGPAAVADVAELLIWVPPDAPADTYQLLVSAVDGTVALPLVVGGGAAAQRVARPLFEPSCAPEDLRQRVPLLPEVFPDVSFAAAAAAGPRGVEGAFAGFANRYLDVIRAELARRGADIESARLALQSAPTQVGSLGVVRRIALPARAADKLQVRSGAALSPVDPSQLAQDTDVDGLPDALEEALARAFQPTWRVSKRERSGTGFTRFDPLAAVRIPTETPVANPPLVHVRVRPLGVSETGNGRFAVAQIDYLTLWNKDNGLPPRSLSVAGSTGTITLALLGSELVRLLSVLTGVAIDALNDGLLGHEGEEEHSAVLVAAPLAPGETGWPSELSRWQAHDYYTAAHEGTVFDQSCYVAPTAPIGLRDPDDRLVERNVELWLSLSKHSTYHFDPDGLPLLDVSFVVVAEFVSIVADVLIQIVRDRNLDIDVVQVLYELSVIITVIIVIFRIVIAEQFVPLPGEESPVVARALVDVGEPEQPRFPWINEGGQRDLRSKFVPLWRLA